MDCPTYSISCRLEEIASAIGEPTVVDILAITVSAFAALGTIAIAVLNIFLLRKQQRLAESIAENEGRAKREVFALALKGELGSEMSAQIAGLDWDLTTRTAEMTEIGRLGAMTGEPNWRALVGCVAPIARYSGIGHKDMDRWFEINDRISAIIDAWVQEPSSADLETPDEFREARNRAASR